jgi:ribokinase
MSTPAIIVLGSSNTDLIVRLPRLPRKGDTVLGGSFWQAPGGKGANQAVAAARAGQHAVLFLSAMGDDEFGRKRLAELRAERLITDYIKIVPGAPSGIAMIFVSEQGQNMIGVAAGANMHLLPEDVERLPAALFGRARVFLASLEVPLQTVRRGLERAKQSGLFTILNPAPADERVACREFLELVDILTPNRLELAQLAGSELGERLEHGRAGGRQGWERDAVGVLRCKGLRDCVVTMGEKGCLVFAGGNCRRMSALPGVQAVDTTAAGDAFSGCLAAALAEGIPLAAAVRFATVGAGLSVTRHGAQPSLPRREEIEAALSAWRGSTTARRRGPAAPESET